ncbi:MAG: ammonium transporter, partial [Arenicellales bacterium]|nr:ammonium transporter [Arenicellales bacterium]
VGLAEGVSIGQQVGKQAIGVVATIIYTGVASFIILKVIDMVIGLRVSSDEESEGLDIALHDERGYNLGA